jgi:catechol 2,3-dioxygenase-like lactoylglutathione lyase family enzyme
MPASFVPIRGLHHFAWRCRDCEETRAFYEDLLGLPLVHVIRSDVVPSTGEHCPYVHIFFRMADGSHSPSSTSATTSRRALAEHAAWVNHIALRVDSLAALRAAKARLEAAGIEVLGITDHHIIESIYFFDPNGIRLELTVPTASAETTAPPRAEAHAAVEAWTGRSAPASTRTTTARRARPRPTSPTTARWTPERRRAAGRAGSGATPAGASGRACGRR